MVVVVVTVNEHNDVRILLDRTGFTQVGKHRRMIRSLLYRTAQLRECKHRNMQFTGKCFQGTGDLGDLVLTGFRPSATAHELQVVNDDHFQIMLQFIFSTFAAELGNADTRCVVDDQIRFSDHACAFDQSFPVAVGQISVSDMLAVHAGF